MATRIASTALPWFLTRAGFRPDQAPPLHQLLAAVREAGYDGIQADLRDGGDDQEYARLLDEAGLLPAPGYYSADLADADRRELVEDARRMAARHAAIGLDRVFLGDRARRGGPRMGNPGVGHAFDRVRLDRVVDAVGEVARAMAGEGVLCCLHPHVGTWIETEEETGAVLAAVDQDVLLFGPDTGHLAWAGANPVEMIDRHRSRIGSMHVKDMRGAVAVQGRAEGWSLAECMASGLWTEPGRGDLDLAGAIAARPPDLPWIVVEVDIADLPSVEESVRAGATWLRAQLDRRRGES